jgi:hypothetical protein
MTAHWTYEKIDSPDADLQQGDILASSPVLKKILGHASVNLAGPDNVGFIVVTQTCDLVRRSNSSCSARSVSLAPVRYLDGVLPLLLRDQCQEVAPGLYSKDDKGKAVEFLRRTLNQNEEKSSLFYLHEDYDYTGIAASAVAFLRLSAALDAREHYADLQKARKCTLVPEFRNRLGWLVGNIYSRVGTPDWDSRKLKQEVKGLLTADDFLWVDPKAARSAQEDGVRLEALAPTEVETTLKRYRPIPRLQAIKELIKSEAESLFASLPATISRALEYTQVRQGQTNEDVCPNLEESIANHTRKLPQKLANALQSNPEFLELTKRAR